MDAYVFDLGFFESVIRDYAQGHLPQLPLTDSTNAVLHFSPALALLAPVVLLVVLADRRTPRAGGGGRCGRDPADARRGRGTAGLGGRRQLRPRAGLRRPDRVRLPRGGAGRSAAGVQHGGDAAQRPPGRRAVGDAARAGQGGPRPDGRGSRVSWCSCAGHAAGGSSQWSSARSRSCWWRCGCCRRPRSPAASPRSTARPVRARRCRSSPTVPTTSCGRCCSCSSRPGSSRCARRCCCWSRCPPMAGGSSPTGSPTGTRGTSTTPSSSRSPSPP